jgi:hypothetical protein
MMETLSVKLRPTKKICTDGPTYLEICPYKFETVRRFTYLGSEVNYKNDNSVDIQKRILSANMFPWA